MCLHIITCFSLCFFYLQTFSFWWECLRKKYLNGFLWSSKDLFYLFYFVFFFFLRSDVPNPKCNQCDTHLGLKWGGPGQSAALLVDQLSRWAQIKHSASRVKLINKIAAVHKHTPAHTPAHTHTNTHTHVIWLIKIQWEKKSSGSTAAV